MKKYLLPSALILLLGGALALAQTFNRAIQLSQDTSGAFLVDSTNNVYFPWHVLVSPPGGVLPTVAGNGSPTVTGSDTSGLVTNGSGSTGFTLTFNRAFLTAPSCVLSAQNGTTITYTIVTTSIAETQNTATSNLVNYWCSSTK